MYVIIRRFIDKKTGKQKFQYYDYITFSWQNSLNGNCKFNFLTLGKLRIQLLTKAKATQGLPEGTKVEWRLISEKYLKDSSGKLITEVTPEMYVSGLVDKDYPHPKFYYN